MMGPSMSIEDEGSRGVIPRAVEAIFAEAMRADESMEFSIKASYVEIYMEKIRDLLDPAGDNLQVRQRGQARGAWGQPQRRDRGAAAA